MDAKQDDDVAANFAAKLGGLKLELGGPSKSAADESDVVKSSSASPPVAAWSARQVSPTPLPSPDMSQSLHATVMRVTDVLGHFYSKPRTAADKANLSKEMVRVLSSYDVSLNEWKRYEFWDDNKKYTRNLIATDNKHYTLMLLCWNPAKASPIHDHAGSECWMRVVQGTAEEVRYEMPKKFCCRKSADKDKCELKQIGSTTLKVGSVGYINDSLGLHLVRNPSENEKCVTLHCYSPPYQQCHVFLNGTNKADVSCTTFYSENGIPVEYCHGRSVPAKDAAATANNITD